VEQFDHDRLSTFGIGANLEAAEWRSVLRQLVMLRLVHVDLERYGVLRLTPTSRSVLRGERRVELRRPERAVKKTPGRRRGAVRVSGGQDIGPVSAIGRAGGALYEALRAWRLRIAREHDVPAYTVLHNSTLDEIARSRPASVDELRSIAGIGAAKLARYGAELLDLVASVPP